MLAELRKMFEKPPAVEIYDLVDALHSCKQAPEKGERQRTYSSLFYNTNGRDNKPKPQVNTKYKGKFAGALEEELPFLKSRVRANKKIKSPVAAFQDLREESETILWVSKSASGQWNTSSC
ncbi:hypothetical protein Tco_1302716 [Tanacetum coccineum]